MFEINQEYILTKKRHRDLTWARHQYHKLANDLLCCGSFVVESVSSVGDATKIRFVKNNNLFLYYDIPVVIPVSLCVFFDKFDEISSKLPTMASVAGFNSEQISNAIKQPALALEIPGVKIFPFDNETDLLDNLLQAHSAVIELKKLTNGYQGIIVHWLGKRYKLTGHQACLDFIKWHSVCVDVQSRYATISKFEIKD